MGNTVFTRPIPLQCFSVSDPFWSEITERVRNTVLPYQFDALSDRIPNAPPSHCLKNFEIAAKIIAAGGSREGLDDGFWGYVFQDSDAAKWIEASAYSLIQTPDKALEQTVDETIDLICSAQWPDGYLNTYYTINGVENRLTNLKDNHELYCLGHLLEAGIAYQEATGKDKLLQACLKYVAFMMDHLGEDKLRGYPGHEILEMALLRLYESCGEEKYLDFARYFINERGQEPLFFREETEKQNNSFPWEDSYFQYQYYQAGLPVRQQKTAEGHAVRAVYLYSAMADLARIDGDEELKDACDAIWKDIRSRKLYITGGIGASAYGESFSYPYDLPNDTIYSETCAAIGLIFFARRMLQMKPRGEYADVMERALYNGVLSSMALDGKGFFYVNPLEVVPEACEKDQIHRHVKTQRQKWFGCACCPPNLARLIESLPTYAFTQNADTLWVNLFLGGTLKTEFSNRQVELAVESGYPWNGNISFAVKAAEPTRFRLGVHIPGWCRSYTVKLNGEKIPSKCEFGYLYLDRTWEADSVLEIRLDMPVTCMQANPLVREDFGKIAVMRGPIVYCLEQWDNGDNLHLLFLRENVRFAEKEEMGNLGRIVKVEADGVRVCCENEQPLYFEEQLMPVHRQKLVFVPYYTWANRGEGEMRVWVTKAPKAIHLTD